MLSAARRAACTWRTRATRKLLVRIADFLLTRIAEDEQRALTGDPFTPHLHADEPIHGLAWHTALCGYRMLELARTCECGVPTRLLAECEAKRRIVERCAAILVNPCGDYSADFAADEILAALASVYADHPDYCEEWRRDTP